MSRKVLGIGAGLAMLLIGSAPLADEKRVTTGDYKMMQDDIVVKPGSGGGNLSKLEWTVGTDSGEPGDEGKLRDDLLGRIKYFRIRDTDMKSRKAISVKFTVRKDGTLVPVLIDRVAGDEFKWTYGASGSFGTCNHIKNQTDSCSNSGIPPLLFLDLVGPITGTYATFWGGESPEIVVSSFELKGK